MAEHSLFSASAAHRWMPCPGSIPLSAGLPNTSSYYAREGTAAHQVLTWVLQLGTPAAAYTGRILDVEGHDITVDTEMAAHVQVTADWVAVKTQELQGVVVVDTRVDYGPAVGELNGDAFGTLDVAILGAAELCVLDFKYGRGEEVLTGTVEEPNEQLALYALGALEEHGEMADFKTVRLAISQPRTATAPDELVMTVEQLLDWAKEHARRKVASVHSATTTWDDYRSGVVNAKDWERAFLAPGEKQCRWCLAKASCPAVRAASVETVFASSTATTEEFAVAVVPTKAHIEPTTDAWLDAVYPKLDLIRGWCDAVATEIERRLHAGATMANAKLVQGKRGNRAWADPAAAEAELRTFRLKVEDMYDLKVISPTTAEKLAVAKTLGPRQWKKLQSFITQADGKPTVAPITDKRVAISVAPVVLEFEPVQQHLVRFGPVTTEGSLPVEEEDMT